jgi:thiamine biosynthesis lipoprotein
MTGKCVTRRRVLTILAMSAASLTRRQSHAGQPITGYEWRGLAMGSDARIIFDAVNPDAARSAALLVSHEIERLEGALSLFRGDSELSRLNRDAVLWEPSGDMRRALELALSVARVTDGLFDPTVQALWEMYADWFASSPTADVPPQSRIARAVSLVDWRTVEVAAGVVRMGAKQRLTLNGLGQGYVTDRASELLRRHGFDHVLIDLGEQRALGRRVDGGSWHVALEGADSIDLVDGALATSEGAGCILDSNGAVHHLFDPRTGHSARHWRRVTVQHPSAAVADALSTAFYAASPSELPSMLQRIGGLTVWTTDMKGRTQHWSSTRGKAIAALPPDR